MFTTLQWGCEQAMAIQIKLVTPSFGSTMADPKLGVTSLILMAIAFETRIHRSSYDTISHGI